MLPGSSKWLGRIEDFQPYDSTVRIVIGDEVLVVVDTAATIVASRLQKSGAITSKLLDSLPTPPIIALQCKPFLVGRVRMPRMYSARCARKELVMRRLFCSLTLICLVASLSLLPRQSSADRFANVVLNKPTDGQFFDVGPEPADSYYVEIQTTTGTFVNISNLLPNHSYLVSYTMAVGEKLTAGYFDADTAGNSSKTTDGNGYWERYAHGTGVLDGFYDFVIGWYEAYGYASINYFGSGGGAATAESDRFFQVDHG